MKMLPLNVGQRYDTITKVKKMAPLFYSVLFHRRRKAVLEEHSTRAQIHLQENDCVRSCHRCISIVKVP